MVHVGFDDPPLLAADARTEEDRLAPYRRVRDEIKRFVLGLPESLASMDRIQTALARFAEGFNCRRRYSLSTPSVSGWTATRRFRIAAGFGGGMGRMASICGAVTGAFLVLGLKHGVATPDREAKEAIYSRIREFADRFQAREGSLVCRELLGFDISDPDGLRRARESGLFTSVCPKLIQDACEILEEIDRSAASGTKQGQGVARP